MDLPENERAKFLDESCQNDQELRDEVEAMLSADEEAEDFIESPILAASSFSVLKDFKKDFEFEDSPKTENLLGMRIGAFKLVTRIGTRRNGRGLSRRKSRRRI